MHVEKYKNGVIGGHHKIQEFLNGRVLNHREHC